MSNYTNDLLFERATERLHNGNEDEKAIIRRCIATNDLEGLAHILKRLEMSSQVVYSAVNGSMRHKGVLEGKAKTKVKNRQGILPKFMPVSLVTGENEEGRPRKPKSLNKGKRVRIHKSRRQMDGRTYIRDAREVGAKISEVRISPSHQWDTPRQPAGEPGAMGRGNKVRAKSNRLGLPTLQKTLPDELGLAWALKRMPTRRLIRDIIPTSELTFEQAMAQALDVKVRPHRIEVRYV